MNKRKFFSRLAAFIGVGALHSSLTARPSGDSHLSEAVSTQPYIGQIMLVPYTFAPNGWAFCHGQLLSISSYPALFSLLGTNYGGDGRVSFGLPDLRGRAPIGQGNGPGLSSINLGQKGGAETHTLNQSEMPSHTHNLIVNSNTVSIPVSSEDGDMNTPEGNYIAATGSDAFSETSNANMADATANLSAVNANTGGNLPHNIRDPFLGLNYVIALNGIFPSQG